MAAVLSGIWWLATTTGVAAVVISLVRPDVRRPAMLVGVAAFTVSGVLGILSIGILFLVAAGVCGIVAARQHPPDTERPATST